MDVLKRRPLQATHVASRRSRFGCEAAFRRSLAGVDLGQGLFQKRRFVEPNPASFMDLSTATTLASTQANGEGLDQRSCKDSARLIRFCGRTRIMPPRGLSMSAMRKNEMATISGTTRSRMLFAAARRVP